MNNKVIHDLPLRLVVGTGDELPSELLRRDGVMMILVMLGIVIAVGLVALIHIIRHKKVCQELSSIQRKLIEARDETRAALCGIGDGIISTNREGHVTRINPVAERLTGWSEAEAAGKPLTEVFCIISEQTREPVENPVERVLRDGAITTFANNILLIARDMTERPITNSGSPIRGQNGEMCGVVVVFRDQAEELVPRNTLQESEVRHRVLFESSLDALMVMEAPTWRFCQANAATLSMFRAKSPEHFTSFEPWKVSPETQPDGRPSADKAREMIELAMKAGSLHFEWTHKRLDGELFPAEVQLTRIDLNGKTAIQACVRDIGERKRVEETRRYDEQRAAAMLALFSYPDDSPQKVIGAALEDVVALTSSCLGFIGFINEANGTMSAHICSKKAMEDCSMGENPAEFSLETAGLWAEPIRQRRTLIVNDYSQPNPMLKGCPAGHVPLSRFMGVPVLRDGCVVMVCGLANKPSDYGEEDERQVRLFMDGLWLVTQKQEAETALRESEEQFRTLIECAPDAVFVQQAGRFVYLNQAAIQLFGVSRQQDLVGTNFMDRIAPEYHEAVHERIRFQTETGAVAPLMEQEYLRLDGARVAVETTAVRVRYQNKEAHLVFVRDVTARKRAQEANESSEALLRIAGRAARFGGWSVDLATGRTVWSNEVAAIHEMPPGYSPLVQEGMDFYAPEWREKITEVFGACAREGRPFDEEMQILSASGRRVWIRTLGVAIRDPSGKITKVQGAFQDITESKRAEEALRKNQEQLRTILDATPFPIALVDEKDENIEFWSRSALKLFGHTAPTAAQWYELAYPDTAYRRAAIEQWGAALENARGSGHAINAGEYQVTCRDGSVRICELHAAFLAERLVVTFNDVTERKQVEAELDHRNGVLNSLLESMPVGVFMVEAPSGKPIFANQTALNILGQGVLGDATKENLATTYQALRMPGGFPYPPDEMPILLGMAGETAIVNDMAIERPDGTQTMLEVFGSPVRDAQGTIWASLVSFLDITERKRADERLRDSENTHRALVEGLPDTVMRFDREGRHLFVSENVREVVPIEAAQFIGKTHRELGFPDAQCRFWEEAIHRVFESDKPFETEFEFESKQGPAIHNWRLAPERDEQGAVRSVLSISRDITAQRRIERDYRTLFREMLNGFALHEIVCDETGLPVDYRFLNVNPAFERMTGLNAETIVGRTVLEVMPDTERNWIERYGKVALSGEPAFFTSYSANFGKHFEVVAFRPAAKQFACIFADVTDRKRAEEELRESKEYLENLIGYANAPIIVWDSEYRITRLNRAFESLTGRNSASVVGQKLNLLFPADQVDGSMALIRKAQSGDRWETVEIEIQHLDGSLRTVLWNSGVILGTDGKTPVATIAHGNDITERKRAEHDRRQLQMQLAQSDRLASMGMLAAGVAHEINNPLTFILYNLESLSEDVPRIATHLAEARNALVDRLGEAGLRNLLGANIEVLDAAVFTDFEERFRDALAGSLRIKDIARGLGTFARVEKDKLVPVDLRFAIESALTIVFNEIKYRARVVKDLNATSPVLGSDGRFSQVFLNLLVNAAHAIKEGNVEQNKIQIRTWQEGDSVFAEVADTGCGIASEHLERIFDPFFTTKPVGVGSGLGLNITKNIIASYGGTITVKSKVQEGTRFLIQLPAANTSAALATDATPHAEGSRVSGRVLVIDDEDGIRASLKRILSHYEVVEAASGEIACEALAKDQSFDLILCDMMMPRMSGIDLHRWLVENHPQLARKLVFVTGGAFTPNAWAYLEEVDNLRVEKPFDATNLQKMVAGWVAASRAKT